MSTPLRFAVLHHTGWPGRPDHFDLLLQFRDADDDDARVLKAFATRDDRFPEPGCALQLLEDHRKAYLHFEGALSAGRGTVARVDGGELLWLQPFDSAATALQVLASGSRLRGRYCLRMEKSPLVSLEEIAEL